MKINPLGFKTAHFIFDISLLLLGKPLNKGSQTCKDHLQMGRRKGQ